MDADQLEKLMRLAPKTPVPLDNGLRERARTIAIMERRTLTAQLVVLIEEAVEAREAKVGA